MNKKIKFAVLITGLVFAVIAGFHILPVFDFLELKSYDMMARFWANTNYSRGSYDIAFIKIDDSSVGWAQRERGWGWPWPRQAYAEIIEFFELAGVKSIAFDILYTEPSVYRNARQDEIIDSAVVYLEEAYEDEIFETDETAIETGVRASGLPRERGAGSGAAGESRRRFGAVIEALRSLSARQDDASFIEASRDAGNIVQAVIFSAQSGTADKWPANARLPLFKPEGFGSLLEKFGEGEKGEPLSFGQFPIPGLIESAAAIGSVTGIPDFDRIYRRFKPFTMFDGKAVPSLSAASLLVSGMGTEIEFDKKTNTIKWEHMSIPVDKNGFSLIKFRGDDYKYPCIYYAGDVLQSLEAIKKGEEPFLNPESMKDLYVFIGVYGQGFFDMFPTPISATYPGALAHINMLDNMLNNDFIRESALSLNLIILLIIVALIVCVTMFAPRISISITGMSAAIAVVIISAFAAYQFGNLWLPMITFLAGAIVPFVTVTIYNYVTEGSQKRFIKSAFSQYLSPKVIEQIIADPSQLKLGGEKREMTAIFTDIRGFSTFSEALGDPSKLVELLNFYLTKMSNIVLDNQGTIDKYEGDAIIAFFGAPIHYANHAALACRAAIGMKKAEPEINREAIETGLVTPAVIEAMYKKGLTKGMDDPCQIFTRIGMNTGDMVVGNMGTPNKMDYTIMGNAVNLAARLEGVNKQYNTGGILISEYTRTQLEASGHGGDFITRPLSRARVVGINTPLRLYELLDTADSAPPELLEMVKNWQAAFDLYEKRDFKGAQALFQSICNKDPNDMAAKKYFNRCEKYSSAPPDEKAWDNGVDNLTEK